MAPTVKVKKRKLSEEEIVKIKSYADAYKNKRMSSYQIALQVKRSRTIVNQVLNGTYLQADKDKKAGFKTGPRYFSAEGYLKQTATI